MFHENRVKNTKKEKKCETCAYALGYAETFINPCPKCVGKTSIFSSIPTAQDVERGNHPSRKGNTGSFLEIT